MEVAANPGSPAFVDAQEEQETWGAHENAAEDGTGVQESITNAASNKQKHSEVFVAGLDREARAEDVIRTFAEVGEVAEVRLRVDSEGMVHLVPLVASDYVGISAFSFPSVAAFLKGFAMVQLCMRKSVCRRSNYCKESPKCNERNSSSILVDLLGSSHQKVERYET